MKIRRRENEPSNKKQGESPQHQLAPMMRALKAIHSVTTPGSMEPEDLERQRHGQEMLGRLITPMIGMKWEPFRLDGMNAAWVRPERPHDKRKAVLYCHGGGYTSGNLGYSRPLASKLSHVTGWDCLCFEYRLAPEHPYPAAVEDALRAWDHLMYLGYGARDVVVAGDSAGGNLALVLCHALKKAKRKLPARLALMSPWTDMTASDSSYGEQAPLDPTITRDYIHAVRVAYAGGRDWTDPMLSPLFGDFAGFPPTLIQVGSNELLLSDSTRLRDRIRAAEVPCRLEVFEGMWHVFQMFPIKTAKDAMNQVGDFLLSEF